MTDELKRPDWAVRIAHPDDVQRIVRLFREHGYDVSPLEARAVWSIHSGGFAAGWLTLPADSDELWQVLVEYIR